MTWLGKGKLMPRLKRGICVDWNDVSSLVSYCDLYPFENSTNDYCEWILVNCENGFTTSCPKDWKPAPQPTTVPTTSESTPQSTPTPDTSTTQDTTTTTSTTPDTTRLEIP